MQELGLGLHEDSGAVVICQVFAPRVKVYTVGEGCGEKPLLSGECLGRCCSSSCSAGGVAPPPEQTFSPLNLPAEGLEAIQSPTCWEGPRHPQQMPPHFVSLSTDISWPPTQSDSFFRRSVCYSRLLPECRESVKEDGSFLVQERNTRVPLVG